jgi:hypothetical protein
MEYAVTLYFDEISEMNINSLILNIAEKCGNKYMVKNKIPPHITISLFQYDENIEAIEKIIDKNISMFNKGDISLASIGIFNPSVLFIMPSMNEYLVESNKKIKEILQTNEKIKIDKYYLKNQWVPHISLAVKLNENELTAGIKTLIKDFKTFDGKINRIAFVKCNPYKDIKIWEL